MNTESTALADWRKTFDELLEDYAGARAEVAVWNVTQSVQPPTGLRLPRSRLAKLRAHVDQLVTAEKYAAPIGTLHVARDGYGTLFQPAFIAPDELPVGFHLLYIGPSNVVVVET